MSLRCCARTGAKLADDTSCGARCSSFPACLPAFPAGLAQQVAQALHSPADEHQAAAAIHKVLDELHAAISTGLNVVASNQSHPRS